VKRLAGEPLRDKHIRHSLVSYLRRLDSSAAIIHELPLSRGDRRADLVRVNGALEGYEIKSEQDSLSRLAAQVLEYEKICEYSTVVVARRHLERAKASIGANWGIIVADIHGSGVSFEIVRKARLNPSLDSQTMVRVLWKTECVRTLRNIGHKADWDAPVIELWERLSNFPPDIICEHLKTALKARQMKSKRSSQRQDDG
jgi:hypothetical protein